MERRGRAGVMGWRAQNAGEARWEAERLRKQKRCENGMRKSRRECEVWLCLLGVRGAELGVGARKRSHSCGEGGARKNTGGWRIG